MAPGKFFHSNEVVGPRTAAAGYKAAHVYVDGGLSDDIGGGICQVSSTLYLASLLADIETVQRLNHVFTVSYVPLGQDATVSYGTIDFKFANSTDWPVMLEVEITEENELVFRIIGTNQAPEKSIQLSSIIISKTDYSTVYVDDPTLPPGTEVVEQYEQAGYTADTYKIVKNGDEVISNTRLHRNVYRPMSKKIRRNPQQPALPDGPASTAEPTLP